MNLTPHSRRFFMLPNYRLQLTARPLMGHERPQLKRSVGQTSVMIEPIDNMHVCAYDIFDGL
jgi:hypothetical protein